MLARTTTIIIATLAAVLLCSPAAAAATGDYAVRITSTSGSQWTTYGRGPFIAVTNRVYSGIANFAAGDYRSWRAAVPGEGAVIVGGRISVSLATPNALMQGRLVVGTGNTPVVLYDGGASGTVERLITSGSYDWAQFDLRSTGTTTSTRLADNSITLVAMDLTLRDLVAPVIEPRALPAPTTWHDAKACIAYSLQATDQGGGIDQIDLQRLADGQRIAAWTSSRTDSLQPAPTAHVLEGCITPEQRFHGDTQYVATVRDVGGRTRQITFSVRADQRPPIIDGGPAPDARVTTARPTFTFSVDDDGAGIASVSAMVDGVAAAVSREGRMVTLQTDQLDMGAHTIGLRVVDASGNVSQTTRTFTVADAIPPQLTIDSPGANGEATAWLNVRALDDMSGVDPSTWLVQVNGEATAVDGDGVHATATIGPLSPGTHSIRIRVLDRSGNEAELTHAYTVASAPVPSMPNVGARSGAYLVESPRDVVVYGSSTPIAVFVSRNGRPMPGQRLEIRRDDIELARADSDDAGIARATVRVGAPGRYQGWIAGTDLDPVDIDVKVAPVLRLNAATPRPRIGQRVVISGRVQPSLAGCRVTIESRVGQTWYPVRRRASTTSRGTFRSTVTPTSSGVIQIRTSASCSGGWARATSNVRTLAVKRASAR